MHCLFFYIHSGYGNAKIIKMGQDLTELQLHIDCHIFVDRSQSVSFRFHQVISHT